MATAAGLIRDPRCALVTIRRASAILYPTLRVFVRSSPTLERLSSLSWVAVLLSQFSPMRPPSLRLGTESARLGWPAPTPMTLRALESDGIEYALQAIDSLIHVERSSLMIRNRSPSDHHQKAIVLLAHCSGVHADCLAECARAVCNEQRDAIRLASEAPDKTTDRSTNPTSSGSKPMSPETAIHVTRSRLLEPALVALDCQRVGFSAASCAL